MDLILKSRKYKYFIWNDFIFKSTIPLIGLNETKTIKKIKKNKNTKIIKINFKYNTITKTKDQKKWILINNEYNDFWIYKKSKEYLILIHQKNTKLKNLSDFATHQVLPYTIADQGHLVFHGANLFNTNKHILILGKSGSGKSTIVSHSTNYNFLSNGDESQVIESKNNIFYIDTLAPTHRFFRNKKSRIKNLKVLIQYPTPPLNGIFILEKSNSNSNKSKFNIIRSKSDSVILKLMCHSYLHFKMKPSIRKKIFSKIVATYLGIPIYIVNYPHQKKSIKKLMLFFKNEV